MKILFISHKHPPSLGGMETQSFHIAQGLKLKHDLTEIVFKGETSRFKYFFSLKKKIKKVLKENEFDLIHLNDGLMAFMLSWLPSYTKTPIVVTFHGLDLIFPNSTYQKRLKKFQTENCYGICVSESTYSKAVERGFSPSNLKWIDNGVDHNFADQVAPIPFDDLSKKYGLQINKKEDILLVSVGRAVPRKGFSWFIEKVFTQLPSNYKYIIIGPNNVSPTLHSVLNILPKSFSRFLSTLMGFTTDFSNAQKAIRTNQLENRVYFLDKVIFPELVNLLKHSDLMIMPNVSFDGDMEGFGLVILEANMCEKYVIGSNMEGITSAIHPFKNGELLPSQDSPIWIEKILSLGQNKAELALKGGNACDYAKANFGWDKMVKEYIDFFEKIGEN